MTRVERAAPAVVWVLLMALVTWAYIPGLDGPMLLDDFVNLRPLERLELDSDFSADIIAGNRSGLTGRPISMASFTLERLYFDHGPYGQKVVGLVLHLVNATLVFLLSLRLFGLASLPRPQWPALIVASLWLSMPLLLSTTLYVVQRMTILSTLFTLLALLSYCEGRVRLMRGQTGWVWFPVTALCAVAAVLSKENGLLAVPLITLTEVFILGFKAAQQSTRRILLLFHSAAAVAAVLLLLVVLLLAPEYVVSGYERRDFTLIERLLTEGRVLLDYLKQMLWVDVHRLGVYHDDFPVSRGLLTPATTLWALAFWLLALAFVAWSAIKRRLLLVGFGVGFFMVGHAMESTIIGLEIYFEHRNYLPAFGILFALAAAARQLSDRWPPAAVWIGLTIACLVARNVVLLGSQAVIWSDSTLLHLESVNSHPRSERALLGLAQIYAEHGQLAPALEIMGRANDIGGRSGAAAEILEAIFYCTAGQPVPEDMLRGTPITRAEIANPHFGDHVYHMTGLVMNGQCDADSGARFADAMENWLRQDTAVQATRKVYGSLVLLENYLERYERAVEYADLLLAKNPDSVLGLQFKLYLSYALERPEEGESARRKLVELRDSGRLSRQEASNLEIFLK